MPLPSALVGRLSLPVISAPMFLVSGVDLVVAACANGIVGTFPSLNCRPAAQLDEWLGEINRRLADLRAAHPDKPIAPHGINLIIHRSNARMAEDFPLVIKHKVPLVISSVGDPTEVAKAVHGYGGMIFHDVTTLRHARKAASAGVDGLILVCAGAGGHAGVMNPFALVPQVREFWSGPLALAGAISDGRSIRAAQVLGADLVYMGTRFIAIREAMAEEAFKDMVVAAEAADIVYTDAFSGINANFLRQSIVQSGLDPDNLPKKDTVSMDLAEREKTKAWKNVWSAGQGVGSIHDVPTMADLVARLKREYDAA